MAGQNVRYFISFISFCTLSIFFQYCFLVPFTCQSHCPLFYLFLPSLHEKSFLLLLILRPFIPFVPLSPFVSFPAELSSLLLATPTINIFPLLSSLSLIIKQFCCSYFSFCLYLSYHSFYLCLSRFPFPPISSPHPTILYFPVS